MSEKLFVCRHRYGSYLIGDSQTGGIAVKPMDVWIDFIGPNGHVYELFEVDTSDQLYKCSRDGEYVKAFNVGVDYTIVDNHLYWLDWLNEFPLEEQENFILEKVYSLWTD